MTKAEVFTCPQCGARLVYRPDGSSLYCEVCAVQEEISQDKTNQESAAILPVAMLTLPCMGCGVEYTFGPEMRSFTCPYCDSANAVEAATNRELIPSDALIPFTISQEQAQKRLWAWLKLHQLDKVEINPIQGLYFPAWYFTLSGILSWFYVRNYRQGGSTISGYRRVSYDEVVVPAAGSQTKHIVTQLKKFGLQRLVPYAPRYLTDWPAEIYTISLAEAAALARRETVAKNRPRIAAEAENTWESGELTVGSAGISIDSFKLIWLPLWIAYYLLDGQRYQVVVNGQRGSVQGERPPWSPGRWLKQLLGK